MKKSINSSHQNYHCTKTKTKKKTSSHKNTINLSPRTTIRDGVSFFFIQLVLAALHQRAASFDRNKKPRLPRDGALFKLPRGL